MRSRRDSVVIFLGALCTLAVVWFLREDLAAALICAAITVVSIPLSIIDFNEHRLPNKYTGPLAIFAVVAVLVLGAIDGDISRSLNALVIAVVGFLVVFVFGTFGGIGMGDVKFSFPLLAVLGWFGGGSLRLAGLTMLLSALAYTLGKAVAERSTKLMVPFGPFMALGFVAGAIYAGAR